MKQSIIKHGTNTRFVMLRESYREMCIYIKNGKIKHNDTAASMLSLFEHLTNAKMAVAESEGKKQPDLWLYLSKSFIETSLLGTAAKMTISEAEKLLVSLGLIFIKQEMEGDVYTRKAYLLNAELVQWVLDNRGWSKIREGSLILEGGYSNFREGGSLILEGGSLILDNLKDKLVDKEKDISSSSSSSREIFQNFEEQKQPPKTNTDEVPQKAFAAVALEKANVSDFKKFAIERNPELAGVNIDYQYYFDSAKSKSNAKTAEKLYASALGFIRTDSSGTGIRIKQSININNQNRNNEKSNNQKSASAFNPKKVNSDTRVKSARQIAEEEAFRADKQAREAAAATQQQQASE